MAKRAEIAVLRGSYFSIDAREELAFFLPISWCQIDWAVEGAPKEASTFLRVSLQEALFFLTESTSLSNLAKLVEEGEILNEETVADSVSAHSVSAAYQTMEQYMDFEEEEAPGF